MLKTLSQLYKFLSRIFSNVFSSTSHSDNLATRKQTEPLVAANGDLTTLGLRAAKADRAEKAEYNPLLNNPPDNSSEKAR